MDQDGTKAWISESDERHLIKIGSLIRFSVKRLNSDLLSEFLVTRTQILNMIETHCF